jgi:hypothetical protein
VAVTGRSVELFRRQVEQAAGFGVFQHPK